MKKEPLNTIALTLCLSELRQLPDAGTTVPPAEIPNCRNCSEPLSLHWGRHSQTWRLRCRCSAKALAVGATEREAIENYLEPMKRVTEINQ